MPGGVALYSSHGVQKVAAMPDREKAAQEDEAATDRLVVRMFKALWLVKKQHKHHRKEHR